MFRKKRECEHGWSTLEHSEGKGCFELRLERNQQPDHVNHREETRFYLKCNEKPLDDFIQESDICFLKVC